MATERDVREIWIGRDAGKHYYEVRQPELDHTAADEHEAIVCVEDLKKARCLRCDTEADLQFKCIHIHTVRKTLDV